MSYYEKNLKTLAFYYPELDKKIEYCRNNLKSELEIIEEESYDGKIILKVRKDNRTCYLNGKRNSQEASHVWVQTLGKMQRNTPVLLMGIGNHFYLKELVEQTDNRITIIVYEPSIQIFLKFLEIVDIEQWMKKHLIIFWVEGLEDMDLKNIDSMLRGVLKYEMLSCFKYLILPNYDVLFEEKAIEFMKICRDVALLEVVNFNTRQNFSNIMVRNLLSNAKYLCDGYKTTQLIEVIPRNIPGIVVAAGPSLNKNIKELKRAKGKAFIIAVDTAIKPMLKEGIIPDMFVVIDALKPLELVNKEEARMIPLVSTLNASPEILDYHTGMKFFYNEGYQFAERIFLKSGQKVGDVSSGGSVATNAFSLLYKIGIQTIILVGQDLAYTNHKSHADGTFQESMEVIDTSHFRMVEGNCDEKVPTADDLKVFIDWYDAFIEGCKERDKCFRVINATEGGAKIQNTEIMSLREAIERECKVDVDISECLKKIKPMLDKENRAWAVEYLRSMPELFQKLEADSKKLKKLYQRLGKVCDKKNIDRREYLSVLKKLEKQIAAIEMTSAYQLVAITMNEAQYILRGEQFLQKDSIQAEGKEIARKGMLYMQNVEKCAQLFREYANEIFCDLR